MTVTSYAAIDCFWLEPTGRGQLSLRRFTFSLGADDVEDGNHHDCPSSTSGCDASVPLDEFINLRFRDEQDYGKVLLGVPEECEPGHDDERWPTACAACGEPFTEAAEWQVNQTQEYQRGDTGGLVYVRGYYDKTVAGALMDLWWGRWAGSDGVANVGADGISLGAICPNGMLWQVDHEATGGGRWTRTGDPRDPPSLTVTPSIQAGKSGAEGSYHGFLQGGRFTDSL